MQCKHLMQPQSINTYRTIVDGNNKKQATTPDQSINMLQLGSATKTAEQQLLAQDKTQ